MEKVNQYFYLMIAGFVALMFAITSKLTFAIKCVVAIFVIIYEGFIIYKYLHHRKVKRFEDNNIIWPPKEFVNSGINECPDYWVKDDTYKSATAGNVRCVNVFNIPTIDQSSSCYSVLGTDGEDYKTEDESPLRRDHTRSDGNADNTTDADGIYKVDNDKNKYLEGDKYYNKKYKDFTKTNKREWIDSCGASERGKAAWIGY
jgi:Ca2+/Na+ antiporter